MIPALSAGRATVLATCVLAVACKTTSSSRLGRASDPDAPSIPARTLVVTEQVIEVPLSDGGAKLGAELMGPEGERGPGIIVVPGAGDVTRHGVRPGDGVTNYASPVAVTSAWARSLAARGAWVLSYDKRTCGPNDHASCAKNSQVDVDAEGPVALAKDVDAACALLRAQPGFDGRLVLMTHGQGAQVAMSSTCAQSAAAVVLFSPIPRAVDEVMVASLRQRLKDVEQAQKAEKDATAKSRLVDEAAQLRNLAGTREAEFASMKAGRFAPTARVSGATLSFWKGWIDLTSRTEALAQAVRAPKIVMVGERDRQYADADRKRIEALASAGALVVKDADHHLLTREVLAATTVEQLANALDAVLAGVPTS